MNIPNFIEIYNNAYSDEFCQSMIKSFEDALSAGFGRDRQSHDGAKKIEKEDVAHFIPNYNMEHLEPVHSSQFNQIFWDNIYKKYASKYGILSECAPHSVYTIKIQKTEPSQGYHVWHSESMGRIDCHRLLTWTVYLNDDFEAGETEFLYQQYRYKPKTGDCLIFPASFTHTHRGNPPIGGTKYIITGWVEY